MTGEWLNALPSSNLGLKLTDNQLRVAAGLRLGVAVTAPHKCWCGSAMDKLGHHALSCRKSAGRFARHTEVNEIIQLAMRTAKVPATLEPAGLSRSDGKRPDGCTLAPWTRGHLLAWDFPSPDTLASSYVRHATAGAGQVAATAEEKKGKN